MCGLSVQAPRLSDLQVVRRACFGCSICILMVEQKLEKKKKKKPNFKHYATRELEVFLNQFFMSAVSPKWDS